MNLSFVPTDIFHSMTCIHVSFVWLQLWFRNVSFGARSFGFRGKILNSLIKKVPNGSKVQRKKPFLAKKMLPQPPDVVKHTKKVRKILGKWLY